MKVPLLIVFLVAAADTQFRRGHQTAPCKNGVCMPLRQCATAMEEIKNNIRPDACWYEGYYPIVCCKITQVGFKSRQKCKEFYKPKKMNRYFDVFAYSLIGGYSSLAKEFPHMAALGFGASNEIKWSCGGSLISEKFVLTAAHCVNTKELGEVQVVRLGDLNLKETTDEAEPQDFNIIRRIKHPKYKSPSQYHDLALLELDRSVRITEYVKPACLQTDREIFENNWIATGWGHVQFGGPPSDHLKKVYLKEFTNNECREFYTNENPRRLPLGIVENMQMCAGEDDSDTCQGDSGGPLQIRNEDLIEGYTIIGVTSFGKACGISNSPGIYTRVSNYIEWIESIVWPD